MSDIKTIIDSSNWADRTKKNRISFISKLKGELDPTSKGISFLKNYDLVSDYLLNKYENTNTRKNKILDIKAVLGLTKDTRIIKKYEMLAHTLINENDEYKGNNIVKDKDRFIPYEDILKLPSIIEHNIKFVYGKLFLTHNEIDTILKTQVAKYKYLKLLIEYIVSILYTKEMPVRSDWALVELNNNNDNINWLDTKNFIIHWNKFKNVKSFGKREFKLNPITINNLKNYLNVFECIIDKPKYLLYLIQKTSYKEFTNELFSAYFKKLNIKYLQKPLTLNDYRHITETHIINDSEYNKLTINEKKNIHDRLLHTLGTAQEYLKVEK
jgi:hypothetical protein